MPTRSKAPRQPHHHGSPPKRRHDQHRYHRPTTAARSPPHPRQVGPLVEGSIAPCARAAVRTAHQHSDRPMAPRDGVPRAPLPPSVLLSHSLFATRWTLPFGMDNAAASLARTICLGANTYVERPLALPCSMEARQDACPVAESPRFLQIHRPWLLGPGRYTLTTLRQQLAEEWHGCFYTAEPDHDFESNNYDPIRECFNIIGAMATIDNMEDEGNATAATAPAPAAGANLRISRNKGQADPPPQDDKAAQLAQLHELKAKLDEDRECLDQL